MLSPSRATTTLEDDGGATIILTQFSDPGNCPDNGENLVSDKLEPG
jgi:hypothetical protein